MYNFPAPQRSILLALFVLSGPLASRPGPIVGAAELVDVGPLLDKIVAVRTKGEGHRDAIGAWPLLAQSRAEQLPEILAGMDHADILPCNWIRAAAETIVQRELANGGQLPVASLESFLADTGHAPRARRLAYELIARVDSTAPQRLIPGLLADPSLELRRDAVAMALEDARTLAARDRSAGVKAYQRALAAARDIEQCRNAAAKLHELGVETNLADHFGFLLSWKLVGPFDNSGGVGFDTAFPPEHEINLNAEYRGKIGDVRWTNYTTTDEYGVVDLNEAFGRPKAGNGKGYADTPETLPRYKGTIAYASTEFMAREPRDVELRIGCINGHKVWLNGALVIANRVFHAGMVIDQYVGQGKLQAGRNVLLIKVAQNEQSDDWAQNWQFQLRVCDKYGTAVLSVDGK